MSTATAERTDLAELLAMLDGEPVCAVRETRNGFNGVVDGSNCQEPARWIAKLHCGHPVVMCDQHAQIVGKRTEGIIQCACGASTVWGRAIMVRHASTGPMFTTGPAPVWLPL